MRLKNVLNAICGTNAKNWRHHQKKTEKEYFAMVPIEFAQISFGITLLLLKLRFVLV